MPYLNFMGIDGRTKVDATTICERNGHSEVGNMSIKLIEPSVRRCTPRDVLNVVMARSHKAKAAARVSSSDTRGYIMTNKQHLVPGLRIRITYLVSLVRQQLQGPYRATPSCQTPEDAHPHASTAVPPTRNKCSSLLTPMAAMLDRGTPKTSLQHFRLARAHQAGSLQYPVPTPRHTRRAHGSPL